MLINVQARQRGNVLLVPFRPHSTFMLYGYETGGERAEKGYIEYFATEDRHEQNFSLHSFPFSLCMVDHLALVCSWESHHFAEMRKVTLKRSL